MFDMPVWDQYLGEWAQNAYLAGATTLDILELLYLMQGRLLPRAKAQELRDGPLAD